MKKTPLILIILLSTIHASKVDLDFKYPLDKQSLLASKQYNVDSRTTKEGMILSTYLYHDDSHLSKKYFDRSESYFKLYRDIFGFLPFKEFSIVETPFPAGYSLPTYTLIGKQIIGMDFVLDNSLGHEIAHQWLGNYVYAPDEGNWVEGMNTFYSDYLYAKNADAAMEYRKNMLIKYDSYVNSADEIALIEFKSKGDESKNAIGYEKATFFFYMLEKKIGKKAFNDGTKKLLEMYPYKVATYKNLREIYEEASGVELLDFFKTWVYNKGALDVKISNINLMYQENRYVLKFDVTNNIKSGYLPISVCSNEECLSIKIDLSKEHPRLELDIEPTKIVVDERYELFRKLDPDELPPVISKILSGDSVAVIERGDEKRFAEIKNVFTSFKYSDEVTFKELKENNIFVFGSANSLLGQIALPFEMEGDGKIEVFKNPLNESKVIAVFEMRSKSLFNRLKHLGKYSKVVFKDGAVVQKTAKHCKNGIRYEIDSGSIALKPNAQKLQSALKEIVKSRVVFIGESHTEFSSHLNQLKVIKAMYKNNPKLSIGMEMFQKPFQSYLDEFIAGKISEKEMIIKTEYFKRWKYDYELYQPIMLYAKEKGIPIVALNIDRDITKMVVSKGLDAISKEQQVEVPNSIDFANGEYKEYLKSVYGMHQSKSFKNFDEFHHAQLLWDESMAKNAVDYLKKNPNQSMAVLAGNGHIMFGHGIPNRVKRRGISDYVITLNSTNPEPGVADYLLYPSSLGTKRAKKLGVYLESDEILKVNKLVENSIATKADIKAGDMLVAFNGTPLKNISDLKTELIFAKESAELGILRDSKSMSVKIEFEE